MESTDVIHTDLIAVPELPQRGVIVITWMLAVCPFVPG